MTRVALVLCTGLAALACACEEVPTLAFPQGDATPDSAPDADGGALAENEDGGCPGSNPPTAPFVCCGPIVCEGQCGGQCDTCMNKCTSPGELCCAKTNNVVCLSAGSICH